MVVVHREHPFDRQQARRGVGRPVVVADDWQEPHIRLARPAVADLRRGEPHFERNLQRLQRLFCRPPRPLGRTAPNLDPIAGLRLLGTAREQPHRPGEKKLALLRQLGPVERPVESPRHVRSHRIVEQVVVFTGRREIEHQRLPLAQRLGIAHRRSLPTPHGALPPGEVAPPSVYLQLHNDPFFCVGRRVNRNAAGAPCRSSTGSPASAVTGI